MKVTVSVMTRVQDNGDGGYTVYAYNNEDELIADHPKSRDGKMTDELRKKILTDDDPYENGWVGAGHIDIDIDAVGLVRLDKPLLFHVGQ